MLFGMHITGRVSGFNVAETGACIYKSMLRNIGSNQSEDENLRSNEMPKVSGWWLGSVPALGPGRREAPSLIPLTLAPSGCVLPCKTPLSEWEGEE